MKALRIRITETQQVRATTTTKIKVGCKKDRQEPSASHNKYARYLFLQSERTNVVRAIFCDCAAIDLESIVAKAMIEEL